MASLLNEYNQLLRQISEKTNNSLVPLYELSSWINFHLQDQKQEFQLTNLFTDLKDCSLLFATLLRSVTKNENFSQVSQISDPEKRAELFRELFGTLGFHFDSPSVQQIIKGDVFELIVFLCHLFLSQLQNKSLIKNIQKEEQKQRSNSQSYQKEEEQEQEQTQQQQQQQQQQQEQRPKLMENPNLIELNQQTNNEKIIEYSQPKQETKKEKKEIEKETQINKELSNKQPKEISFNNKNDERLKDNESTLIKDTEEKQNKPLSPSIEMYASIGNKMISSFSNHNQRVLTSFLNVGTILPELSQDMKNLKSELSHLQPISFFNNEELNSKTIFAETFFKILKSFGHDPLDKELKKTINEKFNQIQKVEERPMSQFLNEILQILKDNKIITGVLSEIEQSIISLIDQFFYSSVFKSRLTDEILQIFLSKKFIKISVRSIDYDHLNKIVYNSIDQFIPGIVDINSMKQAINYLFKFSALEQIVNESTKEQILTDTLKEAFGRSIYFIIDRLFGTGFGDEIIDFFEDKKKGEKRKELYHKTILPETRKALKDYLDFEDADNLVFSVESAICKENSKVYSSTLFAFLDSAGLILPFIKVSIIAEVFKITTSGALFRSNDVNQKVIHHYIDIVGVQYIKKTIGSILTEMQNADHSYEIDSFKITEEENLEYNLQIVIKYFHRLVQAVFNSIPDTPIEMRVICNYYKELTNLRYPEKALQTIGGFIFLRFICPRIVAPYKTGVIEKPIDMKFRRGLLLISSAIQALSNGIKFSEMRQYMQPFNQLIDDYLPSREKFLLEISNINGINEQQLFVPYSNRLKLSNLDKTQINSTIVNKFFRASEKNSITPKKFAIKLLIDCQQYSNWVPKDVSSLYSSIIFDKLKQLNSAVTNIKNDFSPIEKIVEKIKKDKDDVIEREKIQNSNQQQTQKNLEKKI